MMKKKKDNNKTKQKKTPAFGGSWEPKADRRDERS